MNHQPPPPRSVSNCIKCKRPIKIGKYCNICTSSYDLAHCKGPRNTGRFFDPRLPAHEAKNLENRGHFDYYVSELAHYLNQSFDEAIRFAVREYPDSSLAHRNGKQPTVLQEKMKRVKERKDLDEIREQPKNNSGL